MSTLRQKLDYHMSMAVHHGATAIFRSGLWSSPRAAVSSIDDMRESVRLAKIAKEKLDA